MKKANIHELKTDLLTSKKRTIRVWLPNDYDPNSSKRYPVLYMHDGQNMAQPAPLSGYSWNVPVILSDLQTNQEIDGLIVVGIDHGEQFRIPEYTISAGLNGLKAARKYVGFDFECMGKSYGQFLVNEVKPFIDHTYHTLPSKEHTGIAGSSCGGNISLQLFLEYPHIFQQIGVFSPALWIIKETIYQSIAKAPLLLQERIYIDMGKKESKMFNFLNIWSIKRLYKALLQKGYLTTQLKQVIDPDATHTELFWQMRFPEFIRFAYKKDGM
jgi:predicted alpha/beta superfamily hydrolase